MIHESISILRARWQAGFFFLSCESRQRGIDGMTPGQREVLRAWVVTSYDVRGNWVRYNPEDERWRDILKGK